MEKNNKKTVWSWTMYDWANSVYSLVITSSIFPIYYEGVAVNNGSSVIEFFGIPLENSVLYSYALSFSFLLVAVVLPLLSGMADYSGKKKLFLKIFTYLGATACIGLYFFEGPNIEWGIICCIIASVGYSGSLVFYDAFLPEIATSDRYDIVSAKGYANGYIGSVILMVLSLVVILFPDLFFSVTEKANALLASGAANDEASAMEMASSHYEIFATKLTFLLVGLWWIGFAQIPFKNLPDNVFNRKPEGNILTMGYKELQKVWGKLKEMKMTKRYLLAFFFYNMGVQTIMYLATTFGNDVLQLDASKLIATILIIQLVAIGGAYLFARISKLKGNIYAISSMVFIWIFICIFAFFITNEYQFYGLAFVVGMVMGGIQANSRSTFSKLIPTNTKDHASFFSFYDVTFYLSIVAGTFTYGFVTQITNMRNTALALAVFFVISLFFLLRVIIPSPNSES